MGGCLSGGSFPLPWPSRKKTNVHDNGNWKRKEFEHFEHVFSIKHDNFWRAPCFPFLRVYRSNFPTHFEGWVTQAPLSLSSNFCHCSTRSWASFLNRQRMVFWSIQEWIPFRELTYPTFGKPENPLQYCFSSGYVIVPRRVNQLTFRKCRIFSCIGNWSW